MTDEVKLLPCPTPWCDGKGGEPYVFERRRDILGVYCPTCSVSTPYFPTQEQAIECWQSRPTIVTDEVVERVVAWRWRWVYPGRQNGWTLRQSPIEPLESNSLHVAREVEPLYSRATLAAMPAIVGGE